MKKYLYIILIISYFSLNQIQAQELRKGPYLIYPGINTSMTVYWQLDSSIDQCELSWGSNTNYSDGSIFLSETDATDDGHQYSYTIENLIPNTKYYYKVVYNQLSSSSFFHTAPLDTSKSTQILAYGDTRSFPERHDQVTNQMLNEINNNDNPSSILIHSGDWNSTDSESKWDSDYFNRNYVHNMEVQSKVPIMGARGNHEGNCMQYYKYWPYSYYSEHYYSFNYGPIHFAFIDQYVDYSTASEQLNWLEQDLQNTTKPWKIICLHEPGYTDESVHKNNTDVQDFIQPLCLQENVKLVIGGHNHYYAHCLVDGVHHLTLGGGGAPGYNAIHIGEGLVYSESGLNFAKIIVNKNTCTIQIFRTDGSIMETINIDLAVNALNNINNATRYYVTSTSNTISIATKEYKSARLSIININGEIILTQYLQMNTTVLNTSFISNGVYFIKIQKNGKSYTQKILIKH